MIYTFGSKISRILSVILLLFAFAACSSVQGEANKQKPRKVAHKTSADLQGLSKAYFASGCFWCVEAVFESVVGVEEVVSGYSGGEIKNPSYRQVASGQTQHAEAVEVYYDAAVVSYATLLKVFFGSHDPTTLNRQGPDRGPQYRSAVFYQNDEEKQLTTDYIAELNASGVFGSKIVTQVVPFDIFYQAEDYHQDYEKHNPNNPYVQQVSIPRLNRFKKMFPELLKDEAKLH